MFKTFKRAYWYLNCLNGKFCSENDVCKFLIIGIDVHHTQQTGLSPAELMFGVGNS